MESELSSALKKKKFQSPTLVQIDDEQPPLQLKNEADPKADKKNRKTARKGTEKSPSKIAS